MYDAIGDQFLTKSSRVPLMTFDKLSNGKIDFSFSNHNKISGGSNHFWRIVRRAAYKAISKCAYVFYI